jgi:hypothetical protein
MFLHPKNVCMTYFQHFRFSMYLCSLFCKGAFFALLHSFLPDFFITSSSDIVNNIQNLIKESGCRKYDIQLM